MSAERRPPLRWVAISVVLVLGAVLAVRSGDVELKGEAPESAAEPVGHLHWEELTPGLEYGSFLPRQPSAAGDSRIRAVRVDPERLELVLLNATATDDGLPRTAREWALREDLLAVINASMYAEDHLTSIHLMKTATHTNNGRLGRDKAVLALGPRSGGLPGAQILDRECGDYDALHAGYGTLVQSIRMLGCDGENVWQQKEQQWSHAVIGQDGDGRVLLIHSRSPWSTHDFIDILTGLPLDLVRLQYAEGGAPAQLFLRAGGVTVEVVGMSRTPGADARQVAIPNVIGVRARQ